MNKNALALLLLLFKTLTLCFANEQSQEVAETEYRIQTWTTNEGLPQNSINSIVQSTSGYLWLATYGGVAKYDGVKFEKLSARELKNQRFLTLYEDKEGSMWMGTEDNGVFKYTEKSITHFGSNQLWGKAGVHKIFENDAGELVVSVFGQGLFKLVGSSFLKIEHKALKNNTIHHVYKKGNNYLLSTQKGLLRYNSKSIEQLETKGLENANPGLNNFMLRTIFQEKDGSLRLATKDYIYKWGPKNRTIQLDETYGKEQLFLHHLIAKDGTHWMGTLNNGVFIKQDDSTIVSVFHDELSNSGISCLFQDREDNIWVGTIGNGLSKIAQNDFSTIGLKAGLSQDVMLGLYEDENENLWLGTHSKGLNVLKNGKVVQQFMPESGIWTINGNRKGTVWAGLYGHEGLVEFKIHNQEIIQRNIADYYGKTVLTLCYDSVNDRLFVGSEQGLSFIKDSRVHNYDFKKITKDLRPRAIALDAKGTVWLGTRGNGLFQVTDSAIKQYTVKEGLANNNIRSIYIDADENIWIGTYGAGLNLLKNDTFYSLNQEGGLFNDIISAIHEDERNNLWMSCNEGVFKVAKQQVFDFFENKVEKVNCQRFTASNGMGSSETNGGFQPAIWKMKSGELMFPTMKGVAVVNPNTLNTRRTVVQTRIEKVRADNQTINPQEGKYTILPGTKSLEIYYTCPNFTNPELIQFQYKLDGYQSNWTNAGDRRIAFYSTLDPKTYTFTVNAAGADGLWSSTPMSIQIEVQPYLYQTSWFIWTVVISGLLLIVIIFVNRNRQALKREQLLKQEVQERTSELQKEKELTEEALEKVEKQSLELEKMGKAKANFFANVSHELKTPLTLIKGPIEALLQDKARTLDTALKEDLELIQNQSQQLSHLITQLLDIARSEDGKWATVSQVIDVKKIIESLLADYSQGFSQKEVKLSFNFKDDVYLIESDVDIVFKIVSNLLSNALKFTPQFGFVQLSLTQTEGLVNLEIVDSGEGISDEDLPFVFERFFKSSNGLQQNLSGSGIGLALVKQFVEILGGKIAVENTKEFGAIFSLTLPIGDVSDGISVNEVKTELETTSLASETEIIVTNKEDTPLILIVDDNKGIRQFIAKNLEQDFRLMEAEDGVEGFEMAKTYLPDLIISDIMMPRKDGLEMLSDLRQHNETSFIALLLLSAKGSEETRAMGWEFGADGYMAKPFNGKELNAQSKAILSNRNKLREKLLIERKEGEAPNIQETDEFKIQFEKMIQKEIPNPEFSFTDHIQEFNMSLSTFTRTVKEKYQKTPQVYLREKRLLQAKELLQNCDETIAEIAYASGFNSVSYFNRIYKKSFGETPSNQK